MDKGVREDLASREPVARDLALTAKLMRRHLEEVIADVHGGMATWTVLGHVLALGETTQAELARSVGVAGSTLTKRLELMDKAGLVRRRPDPEDRRQVLVATTNLGEQTYAVFRQRAAAEGSAMVAGVDPADLSTMRRVLARVRTNIAALQEMP